MRYLLMCLVVWAVGLAALPAAAQPSEPPGAGGTGGTAAPIAQRPSQPFSVERIVTELKRQYKAGGATMHFILFLSLLGAAFVLERLFRLRRGSVAPVGLAERADSLWQQGQPAQVEALARQYERSALGKIILFAVRHRNNPIDRINAAASDIASREMARHMLFTYPLAMVAVLAPLLGLFGTVVGMIESFETVAVAGTMGDPSLLSSSISKALITTAYGLIVAMPILFCYHMLKIRTQFLANQLDEEASELINRWFLRSTDDSGPARQEVLP